VDKNRTGCGVWSASLPATIFERAGALCHTSNHSGSHYVAGSSLSRWTSA